MADQARTKSISNRQIGQINDRLATQLRKSGLPAASVGVVLAAPGGAAINDMVAALRKHVEAHSGLSIRVSVDRVRGEYETLKATGRTLYVDDDVVKTMPHGEGSETEVVFFKAAQYVSGADIDKEYELRGLKPVDPYSLAAVNEAYRSFADEHPNGTYWKNAQGEWCIATFTQLNGQRSASVRRTEREWIIGLWFAGLRK